VCFSDHQHCPHFNCHRSYDSYTYLHARTTAKEQLLTTGHDIATIPCEVIAGAGCATTITVEINLSTIACGDRAIMNKRACSCFGVTVLVVPRTSGRIPAVSP
jgi:hypothetical protein